MSSITLEQLILLLPEILLAVMAMIIMLLPKKAHTLAWALAAGALAVDAAMCLSLWGVDTDILGGSYSVDAFAIFVKVMLLGLALLNVVGSHDFTQKLERAREYYALLLAAMLGLLIIPSATDYITLLIGFEMASVATYTLPMIDPENPRGKEASLKYYLSGAFSSALILYGLSLLYGFTGTMSIVGVAQIVAMLGVHPMLAVAFVLLLAGFGYKMALVPMHLWAVDTYEGASAPTTGFISGITQKGAFIVTLKIILVSFAFWQPGATVLLGLLCVVTMTVGNVMALLQKDVRRMLAYSSVAHAGNIPVGFVVGTAMGVAGSFIHILSHGLMVIAGFLVLQLVYEKKGGTSNAHFRGLAKQMPVVAAAFMLILMSYGGVPPLLGFWGKMIMVVSALGMGGWYTVLALILVLNSALSLVYYAWVIRDMYMKPVEIELLPEDEAARTKGISSYAFAAIVAVVVLLGFGLMPNLLTELGLTAAAAIW
jgi:NADH-quinone oxidoreductase subunit N